MGRMSDEIDSSILDSAAPSSLLSGCSVSCSGGGGGGMTKYFLDCVSKIVITSEIHPVYSRARARMCVCRLAGLYLDSRWCDRRTSTTTRTAIVVAHIRRAVCLHTCTHMRTRARVDASTLPETRYTDPGGLVSLILGHPMTN